VFERLSVRAQCVMVKKKEAQVTLVTQFRAIRDFFWDLLF
jgi:hypothetical protein